MVLTLATAAAAGSSLSCLFSGSAAATITAIPADAAATTTAQTTAIAAETPVAKSAIAEPKEPNKKFSYGHYGRADLLKWVGLSYFISICACTLYLHLVPAPCAYKNFCAEFFVRSQTVK